MNPPQTSLITNDDIKLFDDNMNVLLYRALMESNYNVNVNIDKNISLYKNMFGMLDYNEFFDVLNLKDKSIYKPISQIIDVNGKLRALIISAIEKSMDFTVVIPPSQPLNLPIAEKIVLIEYKKLENIIENKPISASYSNGLATGIWYKFFDIQDGIYIPIIPIKSNVAIGSESPLNLNVKMDLLTQYRVIERTLNIIFELIKWTYIIGKAYQNIQLNEFSKYMVELKNDYEDDAKIYDITAVEQKLPFSKNINNCLQYIKSITKSTLSDGKKLKIKNETLKNRILTKLKEYDSFTEGLRYELNTENTERIGQNFLPIPDRLNEFYKYIEDFKKINNVKIFLSDIEYKQWKNSLSNNYNNFIIHTKLDLKLSELVGPYMLKDEKEYIYLLRNTDTLEEALKICNERENSGYILFNIVNEKLNVIEYKKKNDTEPCLVLKYNELKYAAILRI
jgi:hypothetical protein